MYISNDTLSALNITPGKSCFLWKTGEENSKREAVAWNTPENLQNVVQMSKTLQDACGFKLGENVTIQGGGNIEKADLVTAIDVTAEEGKVEELGEERGHWEWSLQYQICTYAVVLTAFCNHILMYVYSSI